MVTFHLSGSRVLPRAGALVIESVAAQIGPCKSAHFRMGDARGADEEWALQLAIAGAAPRTFIHSVHPKRRALLPLGFAAAVGSGAHVVSFPESELGAPYRARLAIRTRLGVAEAQRCIAVVARPDSKGTLNGLKYAAERRLNISLFTVGFDDPPTPLDDSGLWWQSNVGAELAEHGTVRAYYWHYYPQLL